MNSNMSMELILKMMILLKEKRFLIKSWTFLSKNLIVGPWPLRVRCREKHWERQMAGKTIFSF
jgi:hypothetical protein